MQELTTTAAIDKRNRVTIPKEIRSQLELGPGDVIEVTVRNPTNGE